MSHTPGPWSWMNGTLRADSTANPVLMPYLCVDNHGSGARLSVSEPNARLIAVAPDMLALLKLALGDTEYVLCQGFWDEVRAVIAKAEGGA